MVRLARHIAVVCACAALGWPHPALAQDPPPLGERWRWAQFTTASGLPSNDVTDLAETSDGVLVARTLAGTAAFDGYRWNVLLDGNTAIVGDQRGGVLLLRGDSLFVVDRSGRTTVAVPDVADAAVLSPDSLLVARGGRLSAASIDPSGTLRISPSPLGASVARAFSTRRGSVLYEDGPALVRRTGGARVLLTSALGPIALGSTAAGRVLATENAAREGLFALVLPIAMKGLWSWTQDEAPVRNAQEPNEVVNAVAVAPSGDALVVYRANLVRHRHDGVWHSVDLAAVGIGNIRTVLWRDTGDLVVGTDHGLFWFRAGASRWTSYAHAPHDPRNAVNRIVPSPDGGHWAATPDGLERSAPGHGTTLISSIDTTRLAPITGLTLDAGGRVWVSGGSAFPGVFRADGDEWTRLFPDGDPRTKIHGILTDRTGRVWLFPDGDAGRSAAFSFEHGAFRSWGAPEGLSGGQVYAFTDGADSSLWFGTAGGLLRWTPGSPQPPGSTLDLARGRWRRWTASDGLGGTTIRALACDREGRVWFSAGDGNGGFGYVDRRDSIHLHPKDASFDHNVIHDMIPHERDGVWLATDRGIYHTNGVDIFRYDTRTGLPYNETFCLARDGTRLLVGTQGMGIAALDLTVPLSPPPQVFAEPAIEEDGRVLLQWSALCAGGELAPDEILARYSLDGGAWSPWARQASTSFRSLGTGPHAVVLQAKGLYGQYDPVGTRVEFVVAPPLLLRPTVLYPGMAALAGILALAATLLLRKRRFDLALRASEDRYRMITELMSDFAYLETIGEDGKREVAWIAESFTNLTGHTDSDARRGEFIERAVDEADREVVEARAASLTRGHPCESELRLRTADGRTIWVRDYAIPVRERGTGRVFQIYGVVRDITQRKLDEEQLRRLASELAKTEEVERRRMATFLHDTVSQSLILAKRTLEGARSAPPAETDAAIRTVMGHLQESIDNARALTVDLCPPILYDLGLGPAIDWLSERMEEAHGIRVEFSDDGRPKPLAPEVRTILYAGARELLVNIVKHAHARQVWIDLRRDGGEVVLAVEDDGVGFGAATRGDGSGFGLTNVRERMRHLGGKLEIEANKAGGARVTLSAPALTTPEGTS